jgi:hypothetical protein
MPNPLENPTPIIVCGVLAEIVLVILLWRSGRGFLLRIIAAFRDRFGDASSENFPARLKIKLQRFDKRWLVTQLLDAGPYRP